MLLMAVMAFSLGLLGCGSSAERVEVTRVMQESRESEAAATTAPVSRRAAPAAPAATRAPMQASEEDASDQRSTGFFQTAPLTDEAQTSVLPQNRVIVRTVDMGIIVPNVARATEDIVAATRRFGGWLVSSDRSQTHQALLSVRVPAESLEDFVLAVRQAAEKVEFETSTSQDVTDEFVDNQARLNGLRRTEERLLQFLEQAVNVEEALNVQQQLAVIQLEIESIQGRLRFLSETAAFSLFNLTMTTKPGEMPVDIGPDATFRAGLGTVFRATFLPPEGVDEFRFTWDFGDGSRVVEGTRTAPTTNTGERVTATVSHTYTDVDQSPYIVQMNIRGLGEVGLFLGSDALIATVTEVPGIEVFAGEDRVVDEGDDVEYTGSFTRPAELRDFRYRWDFGDGSATVFEVPDEDETRAVAKHTFPDHRPHPYPVVLTVIAQSEAGEIRGTSTFNVRVNEVEGFVVAGWDIGSTFKSAVRALSVVGQVVLTILIWVGIFSPVWLAVIAAVIFIPRIRRRFGWGLGGVPTVPAPSAPWQLGRSETVPARPVGTVPPPEPQPPAAPEPAPVAESESTDASVGEQPTLPCLNCGREFLATDANGQPTRYCPFCGAEAPVSDE
jgi:hypothetical protein